MDSREVASAARLFMVFFFCYENWSHLETDMKSNFLWLHFKPTILKLNQFNRENLKKKSVCLSQRLLIIFNLYPYMSPARATTCSGGGELDQTVDHCKILSAYPFWGKKYSAFQKTNHAHARNDQFCMSASRFLSDGYFISAVVY